MAPPARRHDQLSDIHPTGPAQSCASFGVAVFPTTWPWPARPGCGCRTVSCLYFAPMWAACEPSAGLGARSSPAGRHAEQARTASFGDRWPRVRDELSQNCTIAAAVSRCWSPSRWSPAGAVVMLAASRVAGRAADRCSRYFVRCVAEGASSPRTAAEAMLVALRRRCWGSLAGTLAARGPADRLLEALDQFPAGWSLSGAPARDLPLRWGGGRLARMPPARCFDAARRGHGSWHCRREPSAWGSGWWAAGANARHPRPCSPRPAR